MTLEINQSDKQHKNFMIECINEPIKNLCFGTKSSITIKKIGNQINNMYLSLQIPKLSVTNGHAGWINKLGHNIVKNIKLTITHNHKSKSELSGMSNFVLNNFEENVLNIKKSDSYDKMIGNISQLTSIDNETKNSYVLYVPLYFWSEERNTSAYPIEFVDCDKINLDIELEDVEKLIIKTLNAYVCIPKLKIIESSVIVEYCANDESLIK